MTTTRPDTIKLRDDDAANAQLQQWRRDAAWPTRLWCDVWGRQAQWYTFCTPFLAISCSPIYDVGSRLMAKLHSYDQKIYTVCAKRVGNRKMHHPARVYVIDSGDSPIDRLKWQAPAPCPRNSNVPSLILWNTTTASVRHTWPKLKSAARQNIMNYDNWVTRLFLYHEANYSTIFLVTCAHAVKR